MDLNQNEFWQGQDLRVIAKSPLSCRGAVMSIAERNERALEYLAQKHYERSSARAKLTLTIMGVIYGGVIAYLMGLMLALAIQGA